LTQGVSFDKKKFKQNFMGEALESQQKLTQFKESQKEDLCNITGRNSWEIQLKGKFKGNQKEYLQSIALPLSYECKIQHPM
jgi:hypothetical protein